MNLLMALDAALLVWGAAIGGTSARALLPRATRRPKPARTPGTDVLLVRPCAGREPHLERTLTSTSELRDADGVEVVFAVASASDPALATAHLAAERARGRGVDASVQVTTRGGPNNKACQLAAVLGSRPSRPIVVVVDSDVDLTGVSLAELVAPIRAAANVGAVWAPPIEAPHAPTLGDRVSASVLGASLHAFHVLAKLDGGGMVGKCFAVRRDALDRTGGFDALRDVLGEDVELASRLRSLGLTIVSAPFTVRSRAAGRSVPDVVARLGRWLSVVRAQRPALLPSYPLLFAATLPLLLVALATGGRLAAVVAATIALISRFGVAHVASRQARLSPPSVGLVFAADLVLLAAFARALRSRRITWRSRELEITPGGRLVEPVAGRAQTTAS
ncbi:MAG: glycosyltransferase [Polyangiaceae bacterium]